MKKQRIEYEGSSLNFRVSHKLREEIERRAISRNMTKSDYLRMVLEDIHSEESTTERVELSRRRGFLLSKGFLQLVIWIFSKRDNRERTESNETLEEHIATLKMIHGFLPRDITTEFDKVLEDLLRIIRDKGYDAKRFNFPENYEESRKFNYERIADYLLSDKFDDGLMGFVEI